MIRREQMQQQVNKLSHQSSYHLWLAYHERPRPTAWPSLFHRREHEKYCIHNERGTRSSRDVNLNASFNIVTLEFSLLNKLDDKTEGAQGRLKAAAGRLNTILKESAGKWFLCKLFQCSYLADKKSLYCIILLTIVVVVLLILVIVF
jgi:hypothetical protein